MRLHVRTGDGQGTWIRVSDDDGRTSGSDGLLNVQVPVKHAVVSLDCGLLAERLMRDRIHDPLVVHAVLLSDEICVVLSLQHGSACMHP